MIKIYIHNSRDDLYTLMVIKDGYPVASDAERGKIRINKELDMLIDEYKHQSIPIKVVGLDSIKDLMIHDRNIH